jgi:hypothetical protein
VLQLQHAMNQFGGKFEQGVRVHAPIILAGCPRPISLPCPTHRWDDTVTTRVANTM